MNRTLIAICLCVGALVASTAVAQESIIFCDIRPNITSAGRTDLTFTGTIGNGFTNPFVNEVGAGRRGSGTVLYLQPRHNDGWESSATSGGGFPDTDTIANGITQNGSNGSIYIYMDVNDVDLDAFGADNDGEVISSLALDVSIRERDGNPASDPDTGAPAAGAADRNRIQSIAFQLFNNPSVFNSMAPTVGSPWNDFVNGAEDDLNGGAAGVEAPDGAGAEIRHWSGAKAVRVAVEDPGGGPIYNATLGITPRASTATAVPYRVGRLDVQTALRSCAFNAIHAAASTFDVYLEGNNLLNTRTFNPTSPLAGVDTEELHSLGYNGAVPETPAISGNVPGVSTPIADATIIIQIKGDYEGNGFVATTDTATYAFNALTNNSDNVFQSALGSFTSSTIDRIVNTSDTGPYFEALNTRSGAGPTCP